MPFVKSCILLCCLLLLGGCAALTSSQRKAVADYAQLTQAYSQYPSQVATSYVALTYEIDQLRIAADIADSTAVNRLWDSYHNEEINRKKARRVDQSIGLIREYAKALAALSSVDIPDNFGKNATLFGTNADSLISRFNKTARPTVPVPVGFGKLATEVLSLAGKRLINQKQAVALRQFMIKGDTLLQVITADIQTSLEPVKEEWVKKSLKPNLTSYYSRLLGRSDLLTPNRFYYKYQLNKDVAGIVMRMTALEDLADALRGSVTVLAQAHHSVLKDIQTKRTIREQLADIQQLYKATNEAYEHYQKLTAPPKTN
jgi:hypothetical protein